MDIGEKKLHVPQVDRTPIEAPPIVVAVVGPPGVSKFLNSVLRPTSRLED
jgi:ribosome biogenesis protein BMS1